MNIIVCVKQVPGTNKVEVDPVTGVLIRDGVAAKLNPYDLYALETAFCLAGEKGRVLTLSMGPRQAERALLETVYMGAQGGVLVSDRRFAGADVLATAYTLTQALRLMGEYDLVICGKQTTDGDTGQVGAEMAELLGIPHLANVTGVRREGGSIVAEAAQDDLVVTRRLPLPCLICCDGGINTPRLPSYRRKKEMGESLVRVVTLDDFEDQDETHYGLSGSPTQVEKIFPPVAEAGHETLRGDGAAVAAMLADILVEKKFI